MVAEKIFSSNGQHNFAKDKVISKCKNDKTWKKIKGKVPAPLLLKRSAPARYFHTFFNFSDAPSGGGNQNLLSPSLKREGGANYVQPLCFVLQWVGSW